MFLLSFFFFVPPTPWLHPSPQLNNRCQDQVYFRKKISRHFVYIYIFFSLTGESDGGSRSVCVCLCFTVWNAIISVQTYQMLDHYTLSNLVWHYCTVIQSDRVSLWMSAWLCQCVHIGSWQYDMCHRERERCGDCVCGILCLFALWSWWVSHTPAGRGWDFGCHGDALRLVHCTHSLSLSLPLVRSNSESHQIWLTLHKHRISRHQTPRRLCGITAKWKRARSSVINMNVILFGPD